MYKFTPKAKEFLRGAYFAKLGTVMKDGSPHVTPIWYMYEDGKLFVNTTPNRVKYRNIVRDPRVCLLIDDGYPYLVIFGKGRIADERDPLKDIETLAIRYHGEKKGKKQARDYFAKQKRVTIEIVPDRVVSGL
jgi:PPOX class probable F420-dependent enzyme